MTTTLSAVKRRRVGNNFVAFAALTLIALSGFAGGCGKQEDSSAPAPAASGAVPSKPGTAAVGGGGGDAFHGDASHMPPEAREQMLKAQQSAQQAGQQRGKR